ncbi:dTDP-glucose 4,6-dehydratase [Fusarium oxysporum f. sp. lycopersici MN25]|nr:dTDP-glucose 4,6-dehydratase [Fusarium oxysporum f. sp. lycopersici MN25]
MSGIRTNGTNGTSCLHICVPNRFLIWSGHGWIAGLLKDLHHQGKEVYTTTIRMEDATRDKIRLEWGLRDSGRSLNSAPDSVDGQYGE